METATSSSSSLPDVSKLSWDDTLKILPAHLARVVEDNVDAQAPAVYYCELEEFYQAYRGWEELADRFLQEYQDYRNEDRALRARNSAHLFGEQLAVDDPHFLASSDEYFDVLLGPDSK
ncbi:hypothetical protein Rhopal_002725-T1 [Rhodotorula paludigena]|uniref:Uncharacterized protein n=1 Tax=Rhodotorula paludigena TaxID=86838 RepID=A0AAV5GBB9_9BASI|nr:hypothetical protein Rhopal_002725-T1 [Rhodotorula paludigena]